jgi:hypothetical protein
MILVLLLAILLELKVGQLRSESQGGKSIQMGQIIKEVLGLLMSGGLLETGHGGVPA